MKSTNFAKLANAMTKSSILTTLAFDTLLPRVNLQTWIAKLKHKLSKLARPNSFYEKPFVLK
jgi:hypothetical protein